MNGYIYIRTHEAYYEYGVCKLGSFENIYDRDSTYKTGEYKSGHFILILEISQSSTYNSKYIEKIIQRGFRHYHKIIDGGTEFYKTEIIDEIVPFLKKLKFEFKQLSEKDIDNMEHKHRIKKDIIKTEEEIFRDEPQEQYIDEIIYNLHENKKVFVKAQTGFCSATPKHI